MGEIILDNGIISVNAYADGDQVDFGLWKRGGYGFQTMLTKNDWERIKEYIDKCFDSTEGVGSE